VRFRFESISSRDTLQKKYWHREGFLARATQYLAVRDLLPKKLKFMKEASEMVLCMPWSMPTGNSVGDARRAMTLKQLFLLLAVSIVLFGSAAQAWAQTAPTTTLTVTSGGKAVTVVPAGTVVTLTATVTGTLTGLPSSPEVVFCEVSQAINCSGDAFLGSAPLVNGTAVLNLTPGPNCYGIFAGILEPDNTVAYTSAAVSLIIADTGKPQSVTSLVSGGSAGGYTLTATVAGYANVAVSPNNAPSPTGTVSFLDTTNAGAVLATAPLGIASLAQTWTTCKVLPVDSEPQSAVTADFNGDGISDIAVANLFGPSVTILLGNGDGTFTTKATLTTGQFPPSLAVGNFGGSGTDLVVSNGFATTPEVSFFRNDGQGNFTKWKDVALSSTPAGVAVGPSSKYVAVANGTTSGNVTFLLASEGFATSHNVAVDQNPNGIVAMASGVAVTQNPVMQNLTKTQGSVTFINSDTLSIVQSLPVGTNSIGIAAGDSFLAVTNHDDNTVSILKGSFGNYAVIHTIPVGLGPFGIATGDYNGDGKSDIAVANKTDNTVTVLPGDGSGNFGTAVTLVSGMAPAQPVFGNFSGHGMTDLAVTNTADDTVSVLLSLITQTATATATGVAVPGSGTHLVDASFPGDSYYGSSVSAATSLTAKTGTPTLTLAANPTTASVGQQVVLTAVLSPYNAGSVTTNGETITFSNGSTVLGTGVLSSGVATLNVTSLPLGSNNLTAAYPGDSNFSPVSSPTVTFVVNSTAPAVTLAPTSLSFASQNVGSTSASQVVTLTNTGTSSLVVSSVTASTGFGQTNTCTPSVAAGASCTISVDFAPITAGSQTGTVTITDNASSAQQTVMLSGTAVGPAPGLTLSTTSLTFPAVALGSQSPAQAFTITNSGQGPLIISSIAVSSITSTTNEFFAGGNTSNTCTITLAAGATCSYFVIFSPVGSGTRTATLAINDNASGSPQTIALTGTGPSVALSAATGSLTISAPGGSATDMVQVASVVGYSGTATLTCSVTSGGTTPANLAPTCSVNPQQAQISPGSPASATVTVSTKATNASVKPASLWPRTGEVLAALLFIGFLPRRRWRSASLILPLAIGILFTIAGCSGSTPGTTPGTYQVVITAVSTNFTTSMTIPLTLQ